MSNPPIFAPGPRIIGGPKGPTPPPPPGPSLDKANPATTGRQQVDLSIALFVIAATYADPTSKGKRKGLPPHQWLIFDPTAETTEPILVGSKSDKDGVSAIRKESFAGLEDAKLVMAFVPEKAEARKSLFAHQQIWIDVEHDEWVTDEDLALLTHRKRRLIRMPFWRSDHKAARGGLSDGPTADFKKTGLLTKDDLKAEFGTHDKPWDMKVDHEWFRSHISFQFYNLASKKEEIVPRGIVVEAITKGGNVVGGGSSMDDAGNICVQLGVTADQAKSLGFQFTIGRKTSDPDLLSPAGMGDPEPEVAYVDLKAASPAAALTAITDKKPLPASIKERYQLPVRWCSLGMEAKKDSASAARDEFAKHRDGIKKGDEPAYFFHLDDMVVTDTSSNLLVLPADAQFTIFDHNLKIKDPDDKRPHTSKKKFKTNYLRGEEVVFEAGKGVDDTLRLLYREGEFFDVRERRLHRGIVGKSVCLGAREAHQNDHPNTTINGSEVRLITTGIDDYKYHGTTVKLAHLFISIASKIEKDETNGALRPNDEDDLHKLLIKAAKRWDQNHPAHGDVSGAAGKKEYGVVPKGGAKANGHVVKVRHFFGAMTDATKAKFRITLLTRIKNSDGTFSDRSDATSTQMRLINTDADEQSTGGEKDADNVSHTRFTLAHELGHVMGLPDEYIEFLDLSNMNPDPVNSNVTPRVPRFQQSSQGKPFAVDGPAMMNGNRLPRLRFLWDQISAMKAFSPTFLASEGPEWLAEYKTFAGGITHTLTDGNTKRPYDVVGTGKLGRSDLILYRIGDDEGSLGAMFRSKPMRSGADRFDGLVIVRTKFWFDFTGPFPKNKDRFDIIRGLNELINSGTPAPVTQFAIVAPGPRMKHIAVLIQPHFELATGPAVGASAGTADVQVLVSHSSLSAANSLLTATPPTPVTMDQSHVNWSLHRYAFGISPRVASGSHFNARNAPIGALELQNEAKLADAVAAILGESAGTVTLA